MAPAGGVAPGQGAEEGSAAFGDLQLRRQGVDPHGGDRLALGPAGVGGGGDQGEQAFGADRGRRRWR